MKGEDFGFEILNMTPMRKFNMKKKHYGTRNCKVKHFVVFLFLSGGAVPQASGQYPDLPVMSTPRPATIQSNIIIGQPSVPYSNFGTPTSVQKQNARIMQEVQQHQRQATNRMQEVVNDLESKGLDKETCLTFVRSPDYSSVAGTEYFRDALDEISRMLTGQQALSLKDATFLIENAYFGNQLSYADYNKYINDAAGLCLAKLKQMGLDTGDPLAKSMVLFHFMTDTFELKLAGKEKTLMEHHIMAQIL